MKEWINKKKELLIVIVLFITVIYFPLFLHLERLPIRVWDESRIATSAEEMIENENYIVPYNEGVPEMWSVKPPLLIWMQIVLLKTIGYRELSIRLPSAIAAFLLCLCMLFISYKYLKNYRIGFFAVMVMITSHGFIDAHATRTGDYDSLLTLFSTLSLLTWFLFIETSEPRKKNTFLLLFFFMITSGILTKSVTILLFSPAIFFYTLYRKSFYSLLKNKYFYIGFGLCATIVLSYYFLREHRTPGFLKAVYENELGGRYMEALDEHYGPFWYYYDNFRKFQFNKWFFFLPVCWIIGLTFKDILIKRLFILVTISIVIFFLIISTGQTKLPWYDMPLYPLMALIIGIGLERAFSFIKDYLSSKNNKILMVIPYLLILLLFFDPYKTIINKVYQQKEYFWDEEQYHISYYLRDMIRNNTVADNYLICYDEYRPPVLFYSRILNRKGYDIKFADCEHLKDGAFVIANKKSIKECIINKYDTALMDVYRNVSVYKVIRKKN
ncbi:MAG TPA: glycosyltransferase family 39 protein [Bacteroidia bacterium]|nr:glycosyltransferase family 39 protein [Bacteroidia bacterium]